MIVGEGFRTAAAAAHPDLRTPLDEFVRRAAQGRPQAIALMDPPDRESFSDGAPRHLTWAAADRIVSAIANLLRSFGLPADAIVALQLPNTAEGVLALLGVLRAGLIAAPLPLLWRQAEMCAAVSRVGARALITTRRVGTVDHANIAMHVAAETFAIRFVCSFGHDLPDGVIPLDDVFDDSLPATPLPIDRAGDPADHLAVVTFDVAVNGLVPVARSHAELIAAGHAVVTEAGIAPGARQLGAMMTASFAGIAASVVPWLMTGGTLSLHQPFDPAVLAAQWTAQSCQIAVVPGPLAGRLLDAGLVASPTGPKCLVAVWRAPERLAASASWPTDGSVLVDVPVFGEIGLIAARRGTDGKPTALTASRADVPRGDAAPAVAIEMTRSAAGTVAMRGAMVPRQPFPPGTERGDPLRLRVGEDGFVDTNYPCRLDRDSQILTLDGPPAGIVGVGGYRFALRELQSLVAPLDDSGSVAALPDVLAGHRLAGVGADRSAIRAGLAEQGANPLITAAFRERRPGRASAA